MSGLAIVIGLAYVAYAIIKTVPLVREEAKARSHLSRKKQLLDQVLLFTSGVVVVTITMLAVFAATKHWGRNAEKPTITVVFIVTVLLLFWLSQKIMRYRNK